MECALVPHESAMDALAAEFQLDIEELQALLADLEQRSGASAFYIFWNTATPGSSSAQQSTKSRSLVAFTSADGALTFAQRNHMSSSGHPPRLRRLTLLQLIRALLREPAIRLLILVDSEQDSPPGQLPSGIVMPRDELIQRLHIV